MPLHARCSVGSCTQAAATKTLARIPPQNTFMYKRASAAHAVCTNCLASSHVQSARQQLQKLLPEAALRIASQLPDLEVALGKHILRLFLHQATFRVACASLPVSNTGCFGQRPGKPTQWFNDPGTDGSTHTCRSCRKLWVSKPCKPRRRSLGISGTFSCRAAFQ